MSILVCGSMAYDCIFYHQGDFQNANLGNTNVSLNASFLAHKMRKHFGGCAGNIAYGLNILGSKPTIFATMGADAGDYFEYLNKLQISTQYIKIKQDTFTVQLIIINDDKQNQINTFYPGAMQYAHENDVNSIANLSDYKIAIISPDGKDAMVNNAKKIFNAGIDLIFDVGQALPLFNKQEIDECIKCSKYIIVNEYEYQMLNQKFNINISDVLPNLKAFIVTLADKGACLYNNEHPQGLVIDGYTAKNVIDPTGCGDAFRAGFIHGLQNNYTIIDAIKLANKMGANKIAYEGGQDYPIFTK